jgi:hypothetical protein
MQVFGMVQQSLQLWSSISEKLAKLINIPLETFFKNTVETHYYKSDEALQTGIIDAIVDIKCDAYFKSCEIQTGAI